MNNQRLATISYTRGKVQFDESVNLNLVYADLVESVYEGSHNKRRFAAIRHMSLSEFQRVLEEIALAAWHGDGRSTTVREIREHCQASNLSPLLEKFEKGAEAGVTRLLAAFFFRQHGQRAASGDRTFIFTHKSFGEYLAACRIVRAVERMQKQLQVRKTSVEEGWNERDALAHWATLCGPSVCSSYIKDYIHGEFRRRTVEDVHSCRIVLVELFSHMLEHGMPMERVETFQSGTKRTGLGSFPEALAQARNAEETLLVLLNATAVVTKTLAHIRQLVPLTAFGAWFKRIQGQRRGAQSPLAAHSLSWLELNEAGLDMADLYGANFSNASLTAAHLYSAILETSNLERAVMPDSYMDKANLSGANLSRANLAMASLRDAKLVGANLEGANLEGAKLRGANLQGANLQGAKLRGADLGEANLAGANLAGANLRGADLERANLERANLEGADLRGAKLKEANIRHTILDQNE